MNQKLTEAAAREEINRLREKGFFVLNDAKFEEAQELQFIYGAKFGAQWYERSLEGVGVDGAEWVICGERDHDDVVDYAVYESSHLPKNSDVRIKFIEALPVQALIASQQREIEKLRTEKQDWFNGAALNDLYIEQGEEIERLRKALEFYADALWIPTKKVLPFTGKPNQYEETFTSFAVNNDGGKTAREALGAKDE
jgi:hypothetical protein